MRNQSELFDQGVELAREFLGEISQDYKGYLAGTLQPKITNNMKSNFIVIPGKHFYQYAKSAKENNKDYGCCFDLYSAEKYTKDCICFIKHVPDGVIGYALECKNGQYDTITSVFKTPGAKISRCLYSIIDHAKNNGGKRLDCFAGLVSYYNDLGFETYFVEQWDDKQAPTDWNPALGKPAVHYMYVK